MYSERDTTKRKYRGIAEQRQLIANALEDKVFERMHEKSAEDAQLVFLQPSQRLNRCTRSLEHRCNRLSRASLRFINNQGWDFPGQITCRYVSRFTRIKKPHSEKTISQDLAHRT